MSEIKINYDAVYSKTAELRQRIQTDLREAEATYRHAQTDLRRMDSRTNAEFTEAMELNQQKSQVTIETLAKLLTFIETSTRQVEREEMVITRAFTPSRAHARR